MNRRSFLKRFSTAGAAALLLPAACMQGAKKPNFIIFIGDDIAWNDIGAYGHPNIKTPNMDRLAKEGIRFTNAFLTISSCSPSRASIMTGRYPHSTGAGELHQPLPADQTVFAGILKATGYYTASAGKWHLGDNANINFDRIEGGLPSGCEYWETVVKERPQDKPFFFWLASFDAHRDYEENCIPEPNVPGNVVVPPYLPDTKETRKDMALYYDEICRMDSYIGKVLDILEEQGELDNTFILLMSDNGRPFPRCKTRLYDSGVQTPFIVRWSKQCESGGLRDNLVSAVDIAPTLLDLAGLPAPDSMQGVSFVPMLGDKQASVRDYIFAEHNWHDYQAHERQVRSKDYLYIRNSFPQLNANPPADAVASITYQKMIELYKAGKLTPEQAEPFIAPRPAEELYNVKADPLSFINLAENPEYKETLQNMRTVLNDWIQQTDDSVPEFPSRDQFDRMTGQRLN